MSLQVCHCGWSKVTTYQGLRIHQGKMGCMARGVKVEESEQPYLWGKLAFTMDLGQEASIKADYYSDSSLQVCYCGWSKVTTYQGLRIHQGKMGCVPKGMRIQEREQYDRKDRYEEADQRKYQPPKRATVKTEVQALRTNSAAAAVKEEYRPHTAAPYRPLQTATKSHRHLQDFSAGVQAARHPAPTNPEAVRPKVKDRKSSQMAGNWSITNSTIKQEPESPPVIIRTSNQNSGRQPQELSAAVQAKRSVRDYPIIPPQVPKKKDRKNQTASRTGERAESELRKKIQFREEKMSEIREWTERTCQSANSQETSEKKDDPGSSNEAARTDFSTAMTVKRLNTERPTTNPAAAVRPKEKPREEHTSLQTAPESPGIKSEKVFKVKEEPRSPPQHSLQRATNPEASRQLQECGTGVQASRRGDTGSTTPQPPAGRVQPEEKDRKHQTSQVEVAGPVNGLSAFIKLQLAHKTVPGKKDLPDSPSSTNQTEPASAEAMPDEDPHSLCRSAQPPGFSTGLKVKESAQTQEGAAGLQERERESELKAQELPATTGQETADHPKEKDKEDQNLSQSLPDSSNACTQPDPASAEATPDETHDSSREAAQVSDSSTGLKVKELAQMFSSTTTQETAVRPKGQQRKRSQNLPDPTSANAQTNPASARATAEEAPEASCEAAASAQLPDFSTGLKVKDLARMFAATTSTVRPQGKNREEPRQSHAARLVARKLSAATGRETAVQPKKEDKENQTLSQNVPESRSANTKMNAASAKAATDEDPNTACEGFSAGLKVKDLARMFSAITTQQTAVRPKGTKLSQHQDEVAELMRESGNS